MDDDISLFSKAADEIMAAEESGPADAVAGLGGLLLTEWGVAQRDRRDTEMRWLEDLRQYKGIYEPEEMANIGRERSRTFGRRTRTKVKTLDARMFDLLYPSSDEDNWGISRTPVPRISDYDRSRILRPLAEELGREPTQEEAEQAINDDMERRADKMRTAIKDQLTESKIRRIAKNTLHSGHLYGTGIIKGPLVETRRVSRFVRGQDGAWAMEIEETKAPMLESVPIWRWYPSFASTEVKYLPYVFERHLFTRSQIQELIEDTNSTFDIEALREYVVSNPKGLVEPQHWEQELRTIGDSEGTQVDVGLYEVIERWGYLNATDILASGLLGEDGHQIITEKDLHRTFFCNSYMLPNGKVIRLNMYPYMTMEDVYHLYRIEPDEASIFTEGIASIMRDVQSDSNAVRRMILDNGGVCAGPQLEVNAALLSKMVNPNSIRAFKIWLRNGQEPQHQAIRAITFPSHLGELSAIKTMLDAEEDEITAIPRYMAGENVRAGAAGTARGMSMLMGAVGIVIKDLAGEYDEGITKSLILAMFRWNMRHNEDDSIKGDMDVSATASTSLVAKEVRVAELGAFIASVQPEERPYMRWYNALSARARAAELGADIIMDKAEAKKLDDLMAQSQNTDLQDKITALQLELAAGNIKKLSEEIEAIKAKRISTTVGTAYAAMQAGGVAATNPAAAAAGDEILRSAGMQDAHPQGTTSEAIEEPGGGVPEEPIRDMARSVTPSAFAGAGVGEHGGIETPEIEGGQG